MTGFSSPGDSSEPESLLEVGTVDPLLRLETLSENQFRAPRLLPNMSGTIFGGQLIANALTAAMLTTEGRAPHMLQAFFLRPGRLDAPLDIMVQRVRDGASMSHRRVEVHQLGRLIFTGDVSFHDGCAGPEHQVAMPSDIAQPEDLLELQELFTQFGDRVPAETRARAFMKRPWLIKPLEPLAGLVEPTAEPRLSLWIKLNVTQHDDPLLQYASTALISDLWLPATTRSKYVSSVLGKSAALVSLNHSMWFHHRPAVDDWLLFVLDSPVASHGRGVGRGILYDRSGLLIASATQEALLF